MQFSWYPQGSDVCRNLRYPISLNFFRCLADLCPCPGAGEFIRRLVSVQLGDMCTFL